MIRYIKLQVWHRFFSETSNLHVSLNIEPLSHLRDLLWYFHLSRSSVFQGWVCDTQGVPNSDSGHDAGKGLPLSSVFLLRPCYNFARLSSEEVFAARTWTPGTRRCCCCASDARCTSSCASQGWTPR